MGEIGVRAFDVAMLDYEGTLARVFISLDDPIQVKSGEWTRVPFNGSWNDEEGNKTLADGTYTADPLSGGTDLYDSGRFVPGDVGEYVWNIDDGGMTTIATYVSADHVTLTANISLDPFDGFFMRGAYITVPMGYYLVLASAKFTGMADGDDIQIRIKRDTDIKWQATNSVSGAGSDLTVSTGGITWVTATPQVFLVEVYHNNGAAQELYGSWEGFDTNFMLVQLDKLP